LGPAGHSHRPRQRHCGTGIWPDRDIAAGCCGIETACASLPTQSPSRPRTPARKAGVLDLRKRMRPRDRLSAGGRWIRTIGPPVTVSSVGAGRPLPACEGVGAVQRDFFCSASHSIERTEPVSGSAFCAAVSDWQRREEPFAGAGPMVRIWFPPAKSHERTCVLAISFADSRSIFFESPKYSPTHREPWVPSQPPPNSGRSSGARLAPRGKPAERASSADPAEAAHDHRADRIAEHQLDQPPRRTIGGDDREPFDIGPGPA
jgi:hypothetical protein